MPWVNGDNFWVGRHETHGLVLFDKSTDGPDNSVTIFYVAENRIALVSRSIMRQFTSGKNISPVEAEKAVFQYICFTTRQQQEELEEMRGLSYEGCRREGDEECDFDVGEAYEDDDERAQEEEYLMQEFYDTLERLDRSSDGGWYYEDEDENEDQD